MHGASMRALPTVGDVAAQRTISGCPLGDALTDGGDHRPGMAVARLGPDLLLHDLV